MKKLIGMLILIAFLGGCVAHTTHKETKEKKKTVIIVPEKKKPKAHDRRKHDD